MAERATAFIIGYYPDGSAEAYSRETELNTQNRV